MTGEKTEEKLPFLRRLAKDVTANTLAISAASLVPVMAMIGGGVDASRFYMAEARMQAACDAGALAARRAMARNDFDDEHREIGENFFVNNFADGQFGVDDLSYQFTGTADGEVLGEASGDLSTTIMAAFGFDNFDLEVSCQADINISDSDIMMVLDVTGSMAWRADGTECVDGDGERVECPDSRMQDLRVAVENFYTTIDTNTSTNAQVRYGFVPYAAEVNVRDFMRREWMADAFSYSTRRGRNTGIVSETVTNIDAVRTGPADTGSFTRLAALANVETFVPSIDDCRDLFFNPPDGPPTNNNRYVRHNISDLTVVSESDVPNSTGFIRTTVLTGPATFLALSASNGTYNSFSDRCNMFFFQDEYLADATITITEDVRTGFEWEYGRFEVDVSNAFSGTVVTDMGDRFADEFHNWNGCVQHNTIDNNVDPGDFDPIPTGAHDIDIDLVPSAPGELWGPSMPSLSRLRYTDGAYVENPDGTDNYNTFDFIDEWRPEHFRSNEDKISPRSQCPQAEAQTLREINNVSDITDYLSAANGFTPAGSTFHNIGLLWGARLMSPNGLFAADNATAPGGNPIARHLVFMTDGELTAQVFSTSAYGNEIIDHQITPDSDTTFDAASATSIARHEARFQAICNAVRNQDITLWVVAFGTGLTDSLVECATPGRAFQADNADQLNQRFTEIAQTIAALRLTE